MSEDLMNKIVSLCKRRGIIFPGSDIYGGLSNTWDYGPWGAELKNNVKRAWWITSVYNRDDMYGMDASILMHPKVWEASGHVKQYVNLSREIEKAIQGYKQEVIEGKFPGREHSFTIKEQEIRKLG